MPLDASKTSDALAKDVEYKAELLLSAQGHYLRAIRVGHARWATASGAQIGALYENFYQQLLAAPPPTELNAEEVEIYRQEARKKIRILLSKAINVYERTLEAAERTGEANPFVERARENLKRMKDLLLAEAQGDEVSQRPLSLPSRQATSRRHAARQRWV